MSNDSKGDEDKKEKTFYEHFLDFLRAGSNALPGSGRYEYYRKQDEEARKRKEQ